MQPDIQTEIQAGIHTVRQTYIHTYIQADRQVRRQQYMHTEPNIRVARQRAGIHTGTHACIQTATYRHTEIHAYRDTGRAYIQTGRLADCDPYRHRDIQTDIQTARQSNHTRIHTEEAAGRQTGIQSDRQTCRQTKKI